MAEVANKIINGSSYNARFKYIISNYTYKITVSHSANAKHRLDIELSIDMKCETDS